MTPDLKGFIQNQLTILKGMYLDDLNAMSHDHLLKSPGGTARSGYDFTFEVALVNNRIATRLRGEEPDPFNGQERFLRAPEEFCVKAVAISKFDDSMAKVVEAWTSLPEDKMTEKIVTPNGETTALELVFVVITHLAYHDGQLNYIQTLDSDNEVHWKFD